MMIIRMVEGNGREGIIYCPALTNLRGVLSLISAENILKRLKLVTCVTSQLEIFWLNIVAPLNINAIFVTFEVFHKLRGWLNSVAK